MVLQLCQGDEFTSGTHFHEKTLQKTLVRLNAPTPCQEKQTGLRRYSELTETVLTVWDIALKAGGLGSASVHATAYDLIVILSQRN